jgi:hypothetical protein
VLFLNNNFKLLGLVVVRCDVDGVAIDREVLRRVDARVYRLVIWCRLVCHATRVTCLILFQNIFSILLG